MVGVMRPLTSTLTGGAGRASANLLGHVGSATTPAAEAALTIPATDACMGGGSGRVDVDHDVHRTVRAAGAKGDHGSEQFERQPTLMRRARRCRCAGVK